MRPSETRRIVVVDDHAIVRHGIVRLIEARPGFEVVGQSSTAEGTVGLVRRKAPELVILGLNIEDADALELIRTLTGVEAAPLVIVLSVYDETVFAERCIRFGASGYVRKDADTGVLIEAIDIVLSGEIYVGRRAQKQILTRIAEGDAAIESSSLSRLTDREIQVFRLLGRGESTRQVAGHLGLSVKTIETHRAKIMKKLDLENATQLVHRAIEWVKRAEGGLSSSP